MSVGDSKRAYAWCYTLNNYTDDDIIKFETLDCVRHVCAKEVGEGGTPHLQGYIRFNRQQRFSWWKNQFPRVHVEIRKGTESEAAGYCDKGGEVVIDKGTDEVTRIAGRKRSRDEQAAEVIEEIQAGHTYKQIRTAHPLFVFWHRRNVVDFLRDERHFRDNPTCTSEPI